MNAQLVWIARASLIYALALAAMPLLRRHSATARRLVLSVAFGAVLALPLVPAWRAPAAAFPELVARLVTEPTVAADTARATPPGARPGPAPGDVLATAWAIGAALVALRFGVGMAHARRLARRARAGGEAWRDAIVHASRMTGRRVDVRASAEVHVPLVTGIISPIVLVPASASAWSMERKRSVVLHEIAHVAARDLAVQALASIACSLHWYNPLAWLAARRLRLERELAADEVVLRSGVRPSAYAEDLLALAGAPLGGAVGFGDPPVASRVAAIVAPKRPTPLGRTGASAVVVGATIVALGVACTTAPESATPPQTAPRGAGDRELQAVAEAELGRAVRGAKATGGTILVLAPSGDVLAEAGNRTDQPYVTGSTLKSILLAAAIEEGVVNEGDVFDCAPGQRAGTTLRDASPLGQIGLAELVARSGNVGFAQIFDRLGGARVDRALRRFHFAPPAELANAAPGDERAALTAIGATMTATPRQVTSAYAALAEGGRGLVSPSTAARVTALLEGAVSADHGTGARARVGGVRVAGKTGTSEWTRRDGTKATYASFVGFVPAHQPRYVIFVGIESTSGQTLWAGEVAAPVFARVATRALGR